MRGRKWCTFQANTTEVSDLILGEKGGPNHSHSALFDFCLCDLSMIG